MQNKPVKSSAPGSYLGYSLQSTRMCLHLCQAPRGSVVALEVLDDVDVAHPDGFAVVEQSKSGLVSNPIANFAKDLWKTFSNWIDAIDSGAIDLTKTRFRLYVLQKKEGEYAHNLSYAHTEAKVREAVEEIRKAYFKEKPEGCKEYIEKFLAYDPDKLVKLVIAFELETGNDKLIDGIKDCLSISVPDVLLDDACHAAIGWVKNTSDELIKSKQYPAIPRSQFSDWMSNFNNRFSFNYLFKYTLPAPSNDEMEDSRSEVLTMMKQLELIEVEEDKFSEAMSDYLQAKTNKIRWAEQGLVYGNEFEDFKKRLLTKWSLLNKEIRMQFISSPELDRGQLLHLKCMTVDAKLNDVDAPEFFIRGTYQDCSNSKDVGWHPRYRELLDD